MGWRHHLSLDGRRLVLSAVIIDLYSRLAVGWAISERMTAELTRQTLKMTLWRRRMPKNGVVFHSDRGSQYLLSPMTQHALVRSMSAKGNCYDKACAESFFHTTEVEVIHGERFVIREEVGRIVFEHIEVISEKTCQRKW